MTGYQSKKAAALDEDGMYLVHHTQPAQEPRTMKREALKLALEALETCCEDEWHSEDDFGLAQTYDENKVDQAIASIKEALAQPAQEPFGYLSIGGNPIFQKEKPEIGRWQTLYTTPPQQAQEPVQVSVEEFVHIVEDKEHLVGRPIVWAQWPSKEKNND